MSLFEWGEKRFARGIAKAMIRGYKLHKESDPSLNELELVKKTLSNRPGRAAKTLLSDIQNENFWKNTAGNLLETIYLLVRLEYIEYMGNTLDNENPQTNTIFRNTILEEMERIK